MSLHRDEVLWGDLPENGRVLVIDDERSIRQMTRMMLEQAGYDVLEAENGEEALEVITAHENGLRLEAIICGIHTPKINGLDAAAYFRSQYPHLPAVVLTGLPDIYGLPLIVRHAVVSTMEQREMAWR